MIHLTISMAGSGRDAQKMADMISETWIQIARTGKPNISALPYRFPFDLKNRTVVVFDLISKLVNDPRRRERKFIDQFKYVQP